MHPRHHPGPVLIASLIVVSLIAAAPYFLTALEFKRAVKRGRVAIAPEARAILRDFAMWLALTGGRFILGITLIWFSTAPRYFVAILWIVLLGFYEWRCYWRIRGRADICLAMLQQALSAAEMSERLKELERKFAARD